MIERFNFYDIYGYFLPGFALLSLVWLPYGMLKHVWPDPGSELSSAIAAIALAYILGHFLQAVSSPALPSQVKDFSGNLRDLSELMLDPDEPGFTEEFRKKLADHAAKLFGRKLEIDKKGVGGYEPVSSGRQEVFRMARAELVREEKAAYVEQFEGMYSLMRGLTTAFALGAAYYGGWALALLERGWLRKAAFGVAGGGLAATLLLTAEMLRASAKRTDPAAEKLKKAEERERERKEWEKRSRTIANSVYLLLVLATLAVGYALGFGTVRFRGQSGLLALAGAGAFLAALKFYGGYRSYAALFAKEVWESFLSCTGVKPPGDGAAT